MIPKTKQLLNKYDSAIHQAWSEFTHESIDSVAYRKSQKAANSAKQELVAHLKAMESLLDDTAHSVYCNDPEEVKRLNAKGAGIGPCPACAWENMKEEK